MSTDEVDPDVSLPNKMSDVPVPVRKQGFTASSAPVADILLKATSIDCNSNFDDSNSRLTRYGPLSKEDAEQLQLEANEETTKSEDLRLFLQEMRQHLSQQNQTTQQQQQQPPQQNQQSLQYGSQTYESAFDQPHGRSSIPLQHQLSSRSNGGAPGVHGTRKRSVTAEQGKSSAILSPLVPRLWRSFE